MSSIAAPNRTEGLDLLVRIVRTLAGAAILACLLVTFTPFATTFTGKASEGALVNQLGYGALAAAAVVLHLLFTERAVLASLLRPSWLVLGLWLLLGSAFSPVPDQSLRAALFTLSGMIAATGALAAPPDARAFRVALGLAASAVLGLSYAGVILLPGIAIHDASGPEGMHAGLWRGIYSHKNVAGPMMAALFFVGLYLMRCRDRIAGALIAGHAVLFLFKTGSKTSLALLPAVAVLVTSARLVGGRIVPVLVIALALGVTALLTLGTVLVPSLDDVLQAVLPGTTFTGRTDLWRFALDATQDHRWTGFGIETFWQSAAVLNAEASMDLAWDPRGAANSHNGYLDLVIALGLPGLAVALTVLVGLPLRDFVRTRPSPENGRLADLFLMILAFMLLNNFLESSFLARANPNWMLVWLSVVGLRLGARHGAR